MTGAGLFLVQRTCGDLPAGVAWLSERERACRAALRIAKRRAEWTLGRWTAKEAVAVWLGLPRVSSVLAALDIRADPDGAPDVTFEGAPVPLALSLSHRAGAALAAVAPAGRAVGCDLELVEPRGAEFAREYFTLAELRLVRESPPTARARVTTLVWSAKESALKALRVGLRADTRTVEVRLSAERPCRGWWALAVRVGSSGREFAGWWRPDGARIACVVADGAPEAPRMG